jgi:hypothetical protein
MKRSLRRFIFAAFLVLPLTMVGTKISYGVPVAGDSEINVAAGFFHTQGSDSGSFNVDLSYGYYLTPGWELGFRQALNYNFIDGAKDQWRATTTPFLFYNFPFGNIVPFGGLAGGIVWNDQKVTGTLGPTAGVKFFLSEQTFLGVSYRYEWFFHSFRGLENNADHGQHVANIGIGYVWGGARKP